MPGAVEVGEKGLKADALGFASSVVIGVASTAPGYSLAAVLGFVVAAVGFQAPAIMIVAFVPMLFIAGAYYYMNRADPDCGTTFSWATKAMGPGSGWIGGWAIIVADVIVMANLAQIAGLYTFLLFGGDSAADSTFAVTLVGVVWIAVMTCDLRHRHRALRPHAAVPARRRDRHAGAVRRRRAGQGLRRRPPAGSSHPELSWFSPFAIDSTSALISGVLLAVFIYWGWDSAVTVNEETEDSATHAGPARP